MKNRQFALFMALIMCFSLVFGAAAATEGEQIIPSTSQVSPTETTDFIDGVVDAVGSTYGDEFSQAGDQLLDGVDKTHGFLATVQRIIDTIKVALANFINTVFPFFNIGSGSILG